MPLRTPRVLKSRRKRKRAGEKLKQKKVELALKTELLHKLEVQLASADSLELEVAPNVMPEFVLVLNDPSVNSIYEFEQSAECRFVFREKDIAL